MARSIRRVAAGVGALGLLAIGVQLFGTTSASAHDNLVSGASSCLNGTYTVTWTVTNDYKESDQVTVNSYGPSGSALSATSLALAATGYAGDSGTITQTGIPGDATGADLDVKGYWKDDNYTVDSSKGHVALAGTCLPGKQPTAPTFADGGCVHNAITSPTITIPAQSGVAYTIDSVQRAAGTYPVSAGLHKVDASSTQFTLTGDTHWERTLTAPSAGCTTTVVPVSPTVTETSCVDHSPTTPTLTIPTTPGITYTVDKSAPYAPGDSVTVTATPKAGYALGTLPSGWKPSGSGATTTVTFAPADNCGTAVTPVTPDVAQAFCPADSTVLTPPTLTLASTPGVSYAVDKPAPYRTAQTVVITATAAKGYYLSLPAAASAGRYTAHASTGWTLVSDTVATRTITFAASPNSCTLAVSAAKASFTAQQCVSGTPTTATYTIPSSTGVRYQVNGTPKAAGTYSVRPGTAITVVAVPQAHYVLRGQTVWTESFGATPQCSGNDNQNVHKPTSDTGNNSATAPLAATGVPTASLVGVGLVLLIVGGLLTIVATRRRTDS